MGASNSPQLERAVLHGTPTAYRFESPRPASAHHHLMDGPALSPQGQSPGPPGYHPHGPEPVGRPQAAWHGSALPPPPRPSSAAGGYGSSPPRPQSQYTINGNASPPRLQLHEQAHASAVSSSHLPHPYQNGAAHMPPPSPQKSQSRPSTAYDPNARRASLHGLNGTTLTPNQHHPRNSMSPNHQPTLSYSPNTSFPPPAHHQQYQQAAGYSPTKPASSSPLHPSNAANTSFYAETPPTSQQQQQQQQNHHPAVTPQTHNSILRPSPSNAGAPMHSQMHSSPIPPLPSGNTPVIPQKHDTPRPVSRDSVADTPVFPPGVRMTPSPATSFVRPGSSGGPGASSLSFSQSFGAGNNGHHNHGHDGTGDVRLLQTPESDRVAYLPPLHQPGTFAQHSNHSHNNAHGEVVEDGGIAGVATELGQGSVPVKKMVAPSSQPFLHTSPAGRFSSGAQSSPFVSSEREQGDAVMRDS